MNKSLAVQLLLAFIVADVRSITLHGLPTDVMNNVQSFLDVPAVLALGTVDSHLLQDTLQRNQEEHARLIQMRLKCPIEVFLNSTQNAYTVFKNSINQHKAKNVHEHLINAIACIKSFLPKHQQFDAQLSTLHIVLPSYTSSESFDHAVLDYLSSLHDLFSVKKNYTSIRVSIFREFGAVSYLSKVIEFSLLNMLALLDIDMIFFDVKIRDSRAFEWFCEESTVRSIDVFNSGPSIHEGLFSLRQLKALRLSPSISKDLFYDLTNIPSLVEVDFSRKFLLYLGNNTNVNDYQIHSQVPNDSLWGLMFQKGIKHLSLMFVESANLHIVYAILSKHWASLVSFSCKIEAHHDKIWHQILADFLEFNPVIEQLRIKAEANQTSFIDLSFLNYAVSLKSFLLYEHFTSPKLVQSLLFFISSHATLESLTLQNTRSRAMPDKEFLAFYTDLVNSMRFNVAIRDVVLNFQIRCGSMGKQEFVREFARLSRPLFGRELTINGVPVTRVVEDLYEAMPDGLRFLDDSYNIVMGDLR